MTFTWICPISDFNGITIPAYPTPAQANTLMQWMGCARVIWNAKCDEHQYYSTYARKYLPVGTWAPIDQAYAQFKDEELTPWLSNCPSVILRNETVKWFRTFKKSFQGDCGRPRRHKKVSRSGIHLTSEVFRFETDANGNTTLFIGTKKNNIGMLRIATDDEFSIPKSIHVIVDAGHWSIGFTTTEVKRHQTKSQKRRAQEAKLLPPAETIPNLPTEELLEWLRNKGEDWLVGNTQGIDRGVTRPLQCGDTVFDLTPEQKNIRERRGRKIRRKQRQLSRQLVGSKSRDKTKREIAALHYDNRNQGKDFCHKASRALVDSAALISVFENLKIKNMTRKPKPKTDDNGKYLPNGRRQKAGLARNMLNLGLGRVVEYSHYKSLDAGKLVLLVNPAYTSQECASCGVVHSDNRKTQALFICTSCGHVDNADRNASMVIAKRAVKQILHSGTELSARGVLRTDIGRGATGKTERGTSAPDVPGENPRKGKETSKKTEETVQPQG